jgi:hypothetical protein
MLLMLRAGKGLLEIQSESGEPGPGQLRKTGRGTALKGHTIFPRPNRQWICCTRFKDAGKLWEVALL